MTFEFTHRMSELSNQAWVTTSAVGTGLCFLVLLMTTTVWIHPKSRAHLDRVSFRILVYALLANMVLGTFTAVSGVLTGPVFFCGFSIFVMQLTLQFSSFLLFCIALNLQLVIVHGVDGRRMEKFYLLLSVLFSVILAVPPYAAGQYGWDPLEKDCWYSNDVQTQRLIWQVTTQIAWPALTAIGEVICSAVVLVYIVKHHLRYRKTFALTRSFSRASSAPQAFRASRYKYIILRIALYPLASCCVNLLSAVGLAPLIRNAVSHGIHDRTGYNLLLLSDFLYGGRAAIYALLAASDPALIRGVRELFSQVFRHRTDETISPARTGSSYRPTEVFVELSAIRSTDLPVIEIANKAANTSSVALPDSVDERSNDLEIDTRGHPISRIESVVSQSEQLEFAGEARASQLHVADLHRQRAEAQREEQEDQIFAKRI